MISPSVYYGLRNQLLLLLQSQGVAHQAQEPRYRLAEAKEPKKMEVPTIGKP